MTPALIVTESDPRSSCVGAAGGLWLLYLGFGIAVALMLMGGWVIFESRQDTRLLAEQASDNLILAVHRDLRRDIGGVALALQDVIDILSEPGLAQASPHVRRQAVINRGTTSKNLGSLLVLDPQGNVNVDESTTFVSNVPNLADQG